MAETRYICKHSDGMGHCEISDDGYCSGPCTLEEDIEYAPVRHGRWIETVNTIMDYHTGEALDDIYYNCSQCGCGIDYKPNYCPNCGDRMDGENNG